MCDQKFITAHSSETCVAFAEQLHAHDGEDEDDDTEDESEVSQSTNGFPHNGDEEVERRPGLGQLEHSQLGRVVLMMVRMLMMVMLTTTMTLIWISFGLLAS